LLCAEYFFNGVPYGKIYSYRSYDKQYSCMVLCILINFIGEKMDTTKWRTVAIRIESFKLLKGLCDITHRNPSNMIAKIIEAYLINMSKKEQTKLGDLKEQLLSNQE
tara:strand:+ start:188 stop:508 length:321 start_codon:yes stop_codon:yes gene_type:complete